MKFTGSADLPLHTGSVPLWLLARMRKMAGLVTRLIVDLWGPRGFVERVASPIFFQAINNLIGMDWDSSGSTTVTTAVLREALEGQDLPVRVLGGKGALSRQVPRQLEELAKRWDIDPARLAKVSRLAARVDALLVQDGYQLYHHAMFVTEDGHWAVIQQGMNTSIRMARRYHWAETENFLNDPHSGIVGVRHGYALNLASSASRGNRHIILDLVREGPSRVARDLAALLGYKTLTGNAPRYYPYADLAGLRKRIGDPRRLVLRLPRDVSTFEDFVLARGVSEDVMRALALVAELVYREPADWRDPANVDPFKFAFAVGGKDGVPFPVDRRVYDEVVTILQYLVERARGDSGIYRYLHRLYLAAKDWEPPPGYKRPTP